MILHGSLPPFPLGIFRDLLVEFPSLQTLPAHLDTVPCHLPCRARELGPGDLQRSPPARPRLQRAGNTKDHSGTEAVQETPNPPEPAVRKRKGRSGARRRPWPWRRGRREASRDASRDPSRDPSRDASTIGGAAGCGWVSGAAVPGCGAVAAPCPAPAPALPFLFQAPCCGKLYPCRLCHDGAEQHQLDRFRVSEVQCSRCRLLQKVGRARVTAGLGSGSAPGMLGHPHPPPDWAGRGSGQV